MNRSLELHPEEENNRWLAEQKVRHSLESEFFKLPRNAATLVETLLRAADPLTKEELSRRSGIKDADFTAALKEATESNLIDLEIPAPPAPWHYSIPEEYRLPLAEIIGH